MAESSSLWAELTHLLPDQLQPPLRQARTWQTTHPLSLVPLKQAAPTAAIMEKEPGIAAAVFAFTIAERRRDYNFLSRYDHQYMDGQTLSVVCVPPPSPLSNKRKRNSTATAPAPTSMAMPSSSRIYEFRELNKFAPKYTRALRICPSHLASTVLASVVTAEGSVQVEHIEVQDPRTGKWEPVIAWLKRTYGGEDRVKEVRLEIHKNSEAQLEEQRTWWRHNHSHFRLLELPGELRELIYLHTLGPFVIPRLKTITGKTSLPKDVYLTLGTGSNDTALNPSLADVAWPNWHKRELIRDVDDVPIDYPNTNLLCVNKQVYQEARVVGWRDTTKRFQSPDIGHRSGHLDLRRYLRRFQIMSHRALRMPTLHALNHLQLEFTAAAYFEFIGISTRPNDLKPNNWYPAWAQSDPHPSRHISRLYHAQIKTLDLRFMSPKRVDARDPWYDRNKIDFGTREFVYLENGVRQTGFRHCCQKTWIDYFLTLALHYHFRRMPNIKNITLSGCIKNSTREKWERILKDEKRGTPVVHDMQDDIVAMRMSPVKWECFCARPCPRMEGPDEKHAEGFYYDD